MLRFVAVAAGLLYALCLTLSAFAAPVAVSWTHPTQYEDGSALAVADIASTTVQYSAGTTFGTVAGQVVVLGPAASTTIDRPPGSWCFRASATVVAAKGGGTSTFSNVACRAVPFPNPKPPTLIEAILAWLKSVFARWA